MFSGQQQLSAANKQPAQPAGKPISFLNSAYAWLAVYILSLNIRLWFNFQAPHMNAYGACDASEYLRNAIALHSLGDLPASFWQDALSCLFGQANQATQETVRTTLACLNELKISSPVFPSFLIAAFFLTGNSFDTSNWMLMLGAQSFISALTSVIIAHTASLVWDRRIGFTAGLLSAIYPGFIINSGRLYSETFAVFLMSLLVWLVIKDFIAANKQEAKPQNKIIWTLCQIIKGVAAICLQLTRSIMVVASVVLIPLTVVTYWNNKSKSKAIIALTLIGLGYTSVAMPWLALQNVAFGKSTLIVDRVGHYNFFVGNNAESQGWLSIPYPDGRGIEEKSLFTLFREELQKSPSAWMRLMQDKLPRLLKFPWNDFRTSIGPIGICQQITVHQLILLLSIIGITLSLFGNVLRRSDRPQIFCRLMIFSMIAFQLVYCFFITVPRYNLAIMPFLIMFAAAGLLSLWRLSRNDRSTKTAIAVAAISLALFGISRADFSAMLLPSFLQQIAGTLSRGTMLFALAIALWQSTNWLDGSKKKTRVLIMVLFALTFVPVCLPVRAHGRGLEWQWVLTNESAIQTINVTNDQLDSLQNKNCYLLIDSEAQSALVNDAAISINGHKLAGPFIPTLSFANDLSHVLPVGNNSVAFEQEYIFDCLTREAETSNADLRQWFLLPVPREALSASNIIEIKAKEKPLTLFGSTTRDTTITIPSLTRSSWEKAFYGVENTHGLTDARYDQKIKLANKTDAKTLNVFLLSDDVQDSDNQAASLLSTTSDNTEATIKLPAYGKDELWLIRVSGQTRGEKSQAGIAVSIKSGHDGSPVSYQSPWCQKIIAAGKNWQSFDCAFPLKPAALPGVVSALKATFLPVSELYKHRNTSRDEIAPAQVRNLTVQLLHFPALPIEGNYKLYLGQATK